MAPSTYPPSNQYGGPPSNQSQYQQNYSGSQHSISHQSHQHQPSRPNDTNYAPSSTAISDPFQHLAHLSDLEKLRELKKMILMGQHPVYKATPQPAALMDLHLGFGAGQPAEATVNQPDPQNYALASSQPNDSTKTVQSLESSELPSSKTVPPSTLPSNGAPMSRTESQSAAVAAKSSNRSDVAAGSDARAVANTNDFSNEASLRPSNNLPSSRSVNGPPPSRQNTGQTVVSSRPNGSFQRDDPRPDRESLDDRMRHGPPSYRRNDDFPNRSFASYDRPRQDLPRPNLPPRQDNRPLMDSRQGDQRPLGYERERDRETDSDRDRDDRLRRPDIRPPPDDRYPRSQDVPSVSRGPPPVVGSDARHVDNRGPDRRMSDSYRSDFRPEATNLSDRRPDPKSSDRGPPSARGPPPPVRTLPPPANDSHGRGPPTPRGPPVHGRSDGYRTPGGTERPPKQEPVEVPLSRPPPSGDRSRLQHDERPPTSESVPGRVQSLIDVDRNAGPVVQGRSPVARPAAPPERGPENRSRVNSDARPPLPPADDRGRRPDPIEARPAAVGNNAPLDSTSTPDNRSQRVVPPHSRVPSPRRHEPEQRRTEIQSGAAQPTLSERPYPNDSKLDNESGRYSRDMRDDRSLPDSRWREPFPPRAAGYSSYPAQYPPPTSPDREWRGRPEDRGRGSYYRDPERSWDRDRPFRDAPGERLEPSESRRDWEESKYSRPVSPDRWAGPPPRRSIDRFVPPPPPSGEGFNNDARAPPVDVDRPRYYPEENYPRDSRVRPRSPSPLLRPGSPRGVRDVDHRPAKRFRDEHPLYPPSEDARRARYANEYPPRPASPPFSGTHPPRDAPGIYPPPPPPGREIYPPPDRRPRSPYDNYRERYPPPR
ncbi:hypothetical protein SISSUDRAFT_1116276 [Sistotremastrum suecicum HHB10207 ss-3]|uniref:Uncharacterized protein n=1 Tax=Sistotremastrum suecicum HHB10207 ss-3 TaxID=1314776 RepID=A0A166IAW9_9AGAM|nr:hypothetical protein SISSUDRAFT_1116276 [Sistotremastrum suecicum HHB10207 ss-3]